MFYYQETKGNDIQTSIFSKKSGDQVLLHDCMCNPKICIGMARLLWWTEINLSKWFSYLTDNTLKSTHHKHDNRHCDKNNNKCKPFWTYVGMAVPKIKETSCSMQVVKSRGLLPTLWYNACWQSIHCPSDLFQFKTSGVVSSCWGEEGTAMRHKNRERGTEREERQYTIICYIQTVTDIQLLKIQRMKDLYLD